MFWNINEIEAPQLADLMQTGERELRVIDVRQPNEVAAGVIPGAETIPLHTLPLRLAEFHPEEELVMVCRSGARSAQACAFLQQQGFNKVFNLKGGMIGWSQHARLDS